MHYGNELEKIRKKAGLTSVQFAELLGISKYHYGNIKVREHATWSERIVLALLKHGGVKLLKKIQNL